MILIHAYTPEGRYMGCRTVERDNISDRRAAVQAFYSFAEVAANEDLHMTQMNHDTDFASYAVSLNLKLYVERKPCTKPASSPSLPS